MKIFLSILASLTLSISISHAVDTGMIYLSCSEGRYGHGDNMNSVNLETQSIAYNAKSKELSIFGWPAQNVIFGTITIQGELDVLVGMNDARADKTIFTLDRVSGRLNTSNITKDRRYSGYFGSWQCTKTVPLL